MRNENDACGPRDLVTSKKRPRTSVQRLVLDFFRARARARARSIDRAIVSFHPVQRAAPAGI